MSLTAEINNPKVLPTGFGFLFYRQTASCWPLVFRGDLASYRKPVFWTLAMLRDLWSMAN